MHVLTQCPECARQYRTDNRSSGDQFHCLCGEILIVSVPKDAVAVVVTCSSCGGARQHSNEKCIYCGSDFTLHEQDLNTVCPNCLSRISDHGRYCHHCATPIVVTGNTGEQTSLACPRCSGDKLLSSRHIEHNDLNILECNVCAGIWLEDDVFFELEQRAILLSASGVTEHHKKVAAQVKNNTSNKDQIRRVRADDQNLYRKCPHCETMMHRRNYGPGSGIILDQCHQHGFWFDREELDLILRWIKTGGLLKGRKKRDIIARDRERVSRLLGGIEKNKTRFNRSLADYYLGVW